MIPGYTEAAYLPMSTWPDDLGVDPVSPSTTFTIVDTPTAWEEFINVQDKARLHVAKLYLYDPVGASEEIVYLACCNWASSPTDSPANTLFEGRLKRPVNYLQKMFSGRSLSGTSSRKFGDIEILNGDGSLDYLMDYLWDGRLAELYVGDPSTDFADFQLVVRAEIKDLTWSKNRINVKLNDKKREFDETLQPSRYTGAGAINGDDRVKGRQKPLCYGHCLNITPVLIDASIGMYQFHDGKVGSVNAVYFGGVEATYGFDYTYTLSNGTINLFTNPLGIVTMDVHGADDATDGYAQTTADIIKRILKDHSTLTYPDDYDLESFNRLNRSKDGENGIYIRGENESVSIKRLIDAFMDSVNGYWYFDRDNRIVLGTLGIGSTIHNIETGEMFSINRFQTPTPTYLAVVHYAPNNTVMSETDIAGSVSDDMRMFFTSEYKSEEARDTAIEALHTPIVQEVYTNFTLTRVAKSEADQRLVLHGETRDMYKITLPYIRYDMQIGDGVLLTHDRFGLDDGQYFIITSVQENVRTNQTVIEVWG